MATPALYETLNKTGKRAWARTALDRLVAGLVAGKGKETFGQLLSEFASESFGNRSLFLFDAMRAVEPVKGLTDLLVGHDGLWS